MYRLVQELGTKQQKMAQLLNLLQDNELTLPWKSIVNHGMTSNLVDPFNSEHVSIFSIFTFGGQIDNKRSNALYEIQIERYNSHEPRGPQLTLERILQIRSDQVKFRILSIEKIESGVTPVARSNHQIIFRHPCEDMPEGSLTVFGGQDGNFKALNDLFEFNLQSREWTQHNPSAPSEFWPSKRYGHSIVYRQSVDSIVIFGGIDLQNRPILECCEYSFGSRSWKKIDLVPSVNSKSLNLASVSNVDQTCFVPRANHSAVLYGEHNSRFLQSHLLDFGKETSSEESKPLVTGDKMIIFGGNSEGQYYDDMFAIDLDTFKITTLIGKRKSASLLPRIKHTSAILRQEQILIMGCSLDPSYKKDPNQKNNNTFLLNVMDCIIQREPSGGGGIASKGGWKFVDIEGGLQDVNFDLISNHGSCVVSPTTMIVLGGQYNVYQSSKNTKNDKIWLFQLNDESEVLRHLTTNKEYEEFGKKIHARLLDSFGDYKPIGTDVVVNIQGEKEFHLHSFMLSRFEYFRNLIQQEEVHSDNVILHLNDVSVDTFSFVVDFLYGEEPPVFNNQDETKIFTNYCSKHHMNAIVEYCHAKLYKEDYEFLSPGNQLAKFFKQTYTGEVETDPKLFNATVRCILSESNDINNQEYDIKVPMPVLICNDFFHACLRDIWLRNRHDGISNTNFVIDIDQSIFPFINEQYLTIFEQLISLFYCADLLITGKEEEAVISQLIQLLLVSNVLCESKLEATIMEKCKNRISLENAFPLMCFAYQHSNPQDVYFIFKECQRVLKEVLSSKDVGKIVELLKTQHFNEE